MEVAPPSFGPHTGGATREGRRLPESDNVDTNDASPQAASRYKGVLDAAPDAMVITDRLGRIILVNAEAEKLFVIDDAGRASVIGLAVIGTSASRTIC